MFDTATCVLTFQLLLTLTLCPCIIVRGKTPVGKSKAQYFKLPVHWDNANYDDNSCKLTPFWYKQPNDTCPPAILQLNNTIYVMFDINAVEGFNLRRDVYVRLAVFARYARLHLPFFANLRIVLTPWPRLFHWRTDGINQENLPWRKFFNVESMRRYAPVIEFDEFLREYNYFGIKEGAYIRIDQVYRLSHFDEMLSNGVFHDKFRVSSQKCQTDAYTGGVLLSHPKLRYKHYNCLHYQGGASLLAKILTRRTQQIVASTKSQQPGDVHIFVILNSEIVLHDEWSGIEFWRARRSMRFSDRITQIATKFRNNNFNSTNDSDGVQRPHLWELEHEYRKAKGGNYLCAHIRRGDFMLGRKNTTPNSRDVGAQIKIYMTKFNISAVFISTDGTAAELKEIRANMFRLKNFVYTPDNYYHLVSLTDGGVAVIDQLICAHARFFIGTYESTFTYRIYEEREILGFPKHMTFNTFCKYTNHEPCPRNTFWPIVY